MIRPGLIVIGLAVLATMLGLLFSAPPAAAQGWDSDYDRRIQEVISGLAKLNGLLGWTPNQPESWPVLSDHDYGNFASKRPLQGISWRRDINPHLPSSLSLSGLKLQRAADFSRLSALQYLDLHDNQLRGLNLDGNGELATLNAANNQLTSANIGGCPRLTYLSLANNNLEKLNLENNQSLQTLLISSNRLRELNLKGLIRLRELEAMNNGLEALDLSRSTALTRLLISHNNIKELDLSQNADLVELAVQANELVRLDLENKAGLRELAVGRNRLKELKLDNLPEIARLSAAHNEISTLDISGCLKLETLELNGNPLSLLITGENDLQMLVSLNLDGCRLPLSALLPLSGLAKSRARFGAQENVFFEETELSLDQPLDLSAEAELNGSPTVFTVLTDKKRRVRPELYHEEGGVFTFKAPGRYRIEMTNERVFSSEINKLTGRTRRFKVKAVSGLITVSPSRSGEL